MIPSPRELFLHNFVGLYPDAAGGSDADPRKGLGGCIMLRKGELPWVYLPWPLIIRENRRSDEGMKFASRLSVLEAVAALALLSSEPAMLKSKAVRIYSDNMGFVLSYSKGLSTCPYVMTVVMALSAVVRALDIQLSVLWSPRRTGLGEQIADDLSKGSLDDAEGSLAPSKKKALDQPFLRM